MTSSPLTPLSLHILLSLVDAPLHGYGILKVIEGRTDGEETPSTGALYLALQRLEREGHIQPGDAPESETDARRRYWALTPDGRDAARAEVERLAALVGHPSARLLRAEG
ncbi:MAG: helix-turn-helix transcriptional regulator [Gemmatimonadota bacterium]